MIVDVICMYVYIHTRTEGEGKGGNTPPPEQMTHIEKKHSIKLKRVEGGVDLTSNPLSGGGKIDIYPPLRGG